VQVVAVHPPAICKISKDKHTDQPAQEKRATPYHIHILPVLNRHFGNDPFSKMYVLYMWCILCKILKRSLQPKTKAIPVQA
jgi:hypothetical protein